MGEKEEERKKGRKRRVEISLGSKGQGHRGERKGWRKRG